MRVLMHSERVDRGVEWLNENGPAEWWNRIDQKTLDILDGTACILGQVFAADADVTGMVDGYLYVLRNHEEIWNHPSSFGFCDNGEVSDNWRMDLAWKNALHKIRTEMAA